VPPPSDDTAGADPSPAATARFADALRAADRVTAESAARQLLSTGTTLLELYELLTDTMQDVGRCWERGEMSVADEHQATAAAAYVVDRLRGAPPPAGRGTVVLTSLEGERHTLGLAVLAHLFEAAHFRAVDAGDLPIDEIVGLANRQPSLRAVLVSAHLPVDLSRMRAAVRTLRQEVPDATVVVGGPAVTSSGHHRYGAHGALLTARDALAFVGTRSSPLTDREQQVLAGLAEGLSNVEIAQRMGLAPSTVKDYVESILGKLGASTRTGAVSMAFRSGLLR